MVAPSMEAPAVVLHAVHTPYRPTSAPSHPTVPVPILRDPVPSTMVSSTTPVSSVSLPTPQEVDYPE